ncbi:hypothetical protein BBAD15_g12461 [Beauveria bassiana D1-5]|uniref:Uncharacterized protein n=1 Tax=Beauveria bassiana D1-5 TaxID=1245745 RepID=A0A0A2V4B8_BEABA|nr:hypothetical protein BBAD15_g12461 [Beauveria bassiana D1-5]
MQPLPARPQPIQHAHGLDGLGVAQLSFGLDPRPHRQPARLGQQLARHLLVEPGQRHQHHRARQRQRSHPRMEQEHHQQEQRKPRRIEEREHRAARQELAQGIQVIDRLGGIGRHARQAALERRPVHTPRQRRVKARADLDDDHAARVIQRPHQRQQADDHQAQHDQREDVAGRQHAVIDLQHVQRRRQHQQVGGDAEGRHAVPARAKARQERFDL